MIVSFDTIKRMRPPYQVSPKALQLLLSISEKIGEIKATHIYKSTVELRKKNRIKTIQSSLEIEGNTLTEDQITALLENKRVIAPAKDILEVTNAIKTYSLLKEYNPFQLKSLLRAHAVLMDGLVDKPGKLRTSNVGIVKGAKIEHIAPGGAMVNGLMKDLFNYLKNDSELILIKSCVFHYEFEFIHPFLDGNGRMGRLWQTVLLMQYHPVFEYLPIERLIRYRQETYYEKLSESDKKGNSTPFVEFMLEIIQHSLEELLQAQHINLRMEDRIELFKGIIGKDDFSRSTYLSHFKTISAPTASRDIKWALEQGFLTKYGEMRLSRYRFN